MSSSNELISVSVSDSKCKTLLHYFAYWNEKTAEIIEAMATKHDLSMRSEGIYASKSQLKAAIETMLEITNGSPEHGFRAMKLQCYLDNVINVSPDDEEFYIHISR